MTPDALAWFAAGVAVAFALVSAAAAWRAWRGR